MRLSILTLFAICFLLAPEVAQAERKHAPHSVSVSTDSLTWVIGGYSLIGTYIAKELPSFRFHGEVFGIELPESILDAHEPNRGEGWQRRIDGALMLSVDHHPFAGLRGFHWGAGFNVQRSTLGRRNHQGSSTYETFEPIVRVGYQWFPVRDGGLFITPYAVLGFPIHLNEPPAIDGEVYGEAAILPVASVQIGWRFPLTRQAKSSPDRQPTQE